MKHLKQYETIEDKYKDYTQQYIPKYNIGDYILLNSISIRKEYPKDRYETAFTYYKNYGIITGQAKSLGLDNFMYDVKAINAETFILSEIEECYIPETKIKRKLTQKEIEEFEIIITQNKFNL